MRCRLSSERGTIPVFELALVLLVIGTVVGAAYGVRRATAPVVTPTPTPTPRVTARPSASPRVSPSPLASVSWVHRTYGTTLPWDIEHPQGWSVNTSGAAQGHLVVAGSLGGRTYQLDYRYPASFSPSPASSPNPGASYLWEDPARPRQMSLIATSGTLNQDSDQALFDALVQRIHEP